MSRFSIRELVLLMVIVALAVGWWQEKRRHLDAVSDARWLAEYVESGWTNGIRNSILQDIRTRYGLPRQGYEFTSVDSPFDAEPTRR